MKYITMAAFSAQNEADLTLPECAVVEVIGKSLTGWWRVRLAFTGVYQKYKKDMQVSTA